ncbi:hypothetical protein TEA_026104 [Camellia sinensis var. sinensis]|uniref:Protein kinase domain-containing protein n=1 Tax=Camellia sinensis var. sinensis TaxID=542762 RepID=A0A4S4ELI5_CAMSN|nr:hypothetical protein TEA_026104 [Camellia sinensis var. sinensis]
MDREANLPGSLSPSPSTKSNLVRPVNPDSNLSRSFTSTSSSSSSLSSSSTSGFVRNVQAAFKRHRPLNTMQSNNLRPRRLLVPQRETSKITTSNPGPALDLTKTQDELFGSQGLRVGDYNSQAVNTVPVVNENQVDSSITPPSMTGTVTNTHEESIKPFDVQRDQPRSFVDYKSNDIDASSLVEPQHVPLVDSQKKIQFSLGNNGRPCGADDQMATETDNLLSYMGSLALTEMECNVSNQLEAVTNISNGLKHQNFHNVEVDNSLRSGGANSSLFAKKTMELQDRLHQFRNFLHGDLCHHMTQSSVVGSSCATTTLVNSASAPMPNSMTHCSHPHQNSSSNMAVESLGECNVNFQPMTGGNMVQPSCPSSKCTSRMSPDQTAIETQAPCYTVDTRVGVKDDLVKELQGNGPKEGDFRKDPSPLDDNSNKGKGLASDVPVLKSQSPLSKNLSSEVKVEPSKLEKQEKAASGKAASRKKNYDPDLFFKVNGQLYQRLGKIGSGGSSEVHKVISSDCTIYALKKIKLKGRDYATAFGFCQEIEYLNKLKGKNNIIQLIDYEGLESGQSGGSLSRERDCVRRIPPLNLDNVSTQSTSETEKPRRNLRKVSSHPADSVQEHPQNELEKVKRSLRKVHNPNTEGSIQSEADSEKPKYGLEKVLSFSDQNTAEENISDSGEKIKKGTTVTVSKLPDLEATLEPPVVTDKALLQEVMNGSIINKDAKVKEDGYIYMVLEYGEIDLAHMLSQKWKEMDSTNLTIDENWLRFYWQQILLAVKIIHEERIVHSDLKPANFLLVRGSLKLIDFGIAKAILNDTTNIQRDSQVGTLSYMSPEAFMCNETDADGNTIKCGRPSDIWSLGCILYQMVYGRTPFSEFKTFWAKFKVITDPNRKITYEPVSNPWLLDLMRKCLAWERNERWRIPQLLQHPFLVPPIPSQLSSSHQDQSCKLLQLIAESCENNQKGLMLCSELQELLRDPRPAMVSQVSISREEQRNLLSKMSNICFQLQEQLAG